MMVSSTDLPKIVIVCGPTGVGKTASAIRLARRFGGQIVGADSMQIHRLMDIGTAKPTAEEQACVRHHMVDIVDPDEPFDAADYGRRAHAVIQGLIAENVIPFVVGGTGLYIKALVHGLFQGRAVDQEARRRLKAQLAEEGPARLHDRLTRLDPLAAGRIHPNDAYRILRALEVFESTGRSISEHHGTHGFAQARYQALTIGLTLPREQLYARIDRRVEAMLAAGLLEEVRGLLASGYDPGLKSMQSLGYRHMVDFIHGRLAWEEALRTLQRDHRRYAKRQVTWFNAVAGIRWLAPDQTADAAALIEAFLLRTLVTYITK
jgi:tRNA dimethylallyltransferase